MRLVLLALCLPPALALGLPPRIRVEELRSPGLPALTAAAFAVSPNGELWASGRTHTRPATIALARFGPDGAPLAAPAIKPPGEFPPALDATPQLAVGADGRLILAWTDRGDAIRVTRSGDGGRTWERSQHWRDATAVEDLAVTALPDRAALAVWPDGRAAQTHPESPSELHAAIIGSPTPDEQTVDASVCDCCAPAAIAFPDGSVLVAYRGRSPENIRDIRVARYAAGHWSTPNTLSQDGWKLAACPVNGPRLATDGSRAAAAWFTAAGGEPRVLVSFSPDAGARWLAPVRVDRGQPIGQVDIVLLRDTTVLVAWLERDGSLWLRRITPEFTTTEPVMIAAAGGVAPHSCPRLGLARDYTGGRSAATVLVAFQPVGGDSVRFVRVTIPEGDLLASERNCDCAPTTEQLRGFAIRGAFTAADPASNTVQASHAAVPGVLAAGTDAFHVDAGTLASVATGREFLARIERVGHTWRLFDVRLLEAPLR